LTTPGGIALEKTHDRPDPDADPDANADAGNESRMLLDDELDVLFSEEVLSELFDALLSAEGEAVPGLTCNELSCDYVRADVRLRLVAKKRAGAYELASVHRHEKTLAPGDCSRPFPQARNP
jgi:hypothetical protein